MPSQAPLVEQAAACRSTQTPRGSATPAPTLVHVPTEPARAHETQAPVQAVSQQTPSTQWPKAHWLGSAGLQASPFIFLAKQLPPRPLQYVPAAQSASVLHAPPQAFDEQR